MNRFIQVERNLLASLMEEEINSQPAKTCETLYAMFYGMADSAGLKAFSVALPDLEN